MTTHTALDLTRFVRPLVWLMLLPLAVFAAPAEVLTIPGSGNPEFVLGELAKAFNARQSRYRVVVPPSSGTAGAVRDVSEGITPLGRVGRPLRENERAQGLSYLSIGRDAVTVAAGAAVKVRDISSDQLKAVFSGTLANWRQLGGSPAPIRVIGKESTDALRSQLATFLKGITYGDNVKIVHLDPQLIELLDRYPTSFTVINRSALGAARTGVVTLALDGQAPSLENIENGRYPLTMELGLIQKADKSSPVAREFIEFIRSPAGAAILRQHGVLPFAGPK